MEIRRTANAGILLTLDGISILMDGVCREVKPYPATPPEERQMLTARYPDVIAFTHCHKDHYDPGFAAAYQRQTNGVILGPSDLPGCKATSQAVSVSGVTVTPVESRHIGAAGKTVKHMSYVVEGSACVWFLGDATPLQFKSRADLPRPDVLVVPYAYAVTATGWEIAKSTGAKQIILLHMPKREEDTLGLWDAVETTVPKGSIHIPEVGETLCLSI